jgi:hypothetical protein
MASRTLDWPGAIPATTGLGALTYALIESQLPAFRTAVIL